MLCIPVVNNHIKLFNVLCCIEDQSENVLMKHDPVNILDLP